MSNKSKHGSISRTIALLHRLDKTFLPLAVFGGLIEAISYYIPVVILANVLDGISSGTAFIPLLMLAITGVAVHFAANILQSHVSKALGVKSEYLSQYFETLISRKTLTMDYTQLESPRTMEIQSQIKSDRSWGSGFYGITFKVQIIAQNLVGTIMSLAIIVPLLIRSLQSGNLWFAASIIFVFTVSLSSSLFFMRWYGKREVDGMNGMTQAEMKSRFHYLNEGGGALSYRDIKDLLVYGAVKLIRRTIQAEQQTVRRHTIALSRLNSFGGVVKGTSSGVLLITSYAMVTLCALSGQVGVGFITQYAQSIYRLSISLSSLLQMSTEFTVDAKRLDSTMDYLDNEDVSLPNHGKIPPHSIHTIEFKDVSFTYPGAAQKALNHLNVTIYADRRTAIVGLNGSGKTTLVKLLCGLYKPDEGVILLDGKDISQFDENSYRRLLAVVFQDFSLFSFPLGNVVASSDIYDPQRAKDTLQRAGFGARLNRMEKGLESVLYRDYSDDGLEVSGGEAQKIAIARAIYKDAPLIILDEPTAALDPVAEQEIYSGFSKLADGKGVIYISHRLSSCRFCDEILVLDCGKIVEHGQHENLLSLNGPYSQLWNAQAQYYRSDAHPNHV